MAKRKKKSGFAIDDSMDERLCRAIKSMRDIIDFEVAAGIFEDFSIVDIAVDMAVSDREEDFPREFLEPIAERMTADAMARHRELQASWPAVTDCDRLDKAFAALEESGLTIGPGIYSGIFRGSRGCLFFDYSDLEETFAGKGLYLHYQSVEETDEANTQLARESAAALRAQGLKVTWDGDVSRAIHVQMDWQRRQQP